MALSLNKARVTAIVAWLALNTLSSPAQTPPHVTVDGGILEGVTLTSPVGGAVFRGIPYAAPPVGDHRWKPPQGTSRGAPFAWRAIGPSCPQVIDAQDTWAMPIYAAFSREKDVRFPTRRTSEDCLFLNVWSTNVLRREAPQPVMVWIHGGSNLMGEAVGGWNSGEALAGLGVVVVAINYRLGALGFMAHPGLTAESPSRSSGNYGLLDQLEALRWVQRNIAAFGGDPARVTVFGESAGALNILHLVGSPLSTGLFQRGIVQSGALGSMPRLPALESRGVELATKIAGGAAGDNLSTLRAVAADAIVKAASQFSFVPVVDGG